MSMSIIDFIAWLNQYFTAVFSVPLSGSLFLTLGLGALIGTVMGLTGAGGGVLAIPLLVLILHLPLQAAAPIGLVAVGLAALTGAILGLRQGIVRYRAAALMGGTGIVCAPLGVYLAQILPNRPLLVLFSMVLVFAAWRILRSDQAVKDNSIACQVSHADHRLTWTRPCARALTGIGLSSGLLSGLLGVGGGFVIIPALAHYTDLNLKNIQATSLAVIALVSVSGVSAAALQGRVIWLVAIPFAAAAMIALGLARLLANRLNPLILQKIFAWFCLAIACLMLFKGLA